MSFMLGLPEDYGTYLFVLKGNVIKEGYYSSFPHPNSDYVVRYAEIEVGSFYYLSEDDILGYLNINVEREILTAVNEYFKGDK